jgi:DNA-binding beta-propeller fold protein YncE
MQRNALLNCTLATALAVAFLPWGIVPAVRVQAGTQAPVLVVVNQGDHDISLIDPGTQHQVATVDVGGITGHEAVVSPDGRTAYVPIYGDSGVGRAGTDGDRITVIDLPSRKVTGSIQFDHGVRPHCIRFDAHTGMLLVTTELDQSITIIDPKSLKIVGAVPTGQAQSHMLVLSHDGRFGYTANVGPGTVAVLDIPARKNLTVIPISGNTQRISISADDRLVFTADQTQPRLAVIDTASKTRTNWITLPGLGYGTAPTVDGRWLLVALRTLDQVAVIDLHTMTVVRTINTPAKPTEILARPDGKVAYVSCSDAGKIAVIDLAHWNVTSAIEAGKDADGLAWGQ